MPRMLLLLLLCALAQHPRAEASTAQSRTCAGDTCCVDKRDDCAKHVAKAATLAGVEPSSPRACMKSSTGLSAATAVWLKTHCRRSCGLCDERPATLGKVAVCITGRIAFCSAAEFAEARWAKALFDPVREATQAPVDLFLVSSNDGCERVSRVFPTLVKRSKCGEDDDVALPALAARLESPLRRAGFRHQLALGHVRQNMFQTHDLRACLGMIEAAEQEAGGQKYEVLVRMRGDLSFCGPALPSLGSDLLAPGPDSDAGSENANKSSGRADMRIHASSHHTLLGLKPEHGGQVNDCFFYGRRKAMGHALDSHTWWEELDRRTSASATAAAAAASAAEQTPKEITFHSVGIMEELYLMHFHSRGLRVVAEPELLHNRVGIEPDGFVCSDATFAETAHSTVRQRLREDRCGQVPTSGAVHKAAQKLGYRGDRTSACLLYNWAFDINPVEVDQKTHNYMKGLASAQVAKDTEKAYKHFDNDCRWFLSPSCLFNMDVAAARLLASVRHFSSRKWHVSLPSGRGKDKGKGDGPWWAWLRKDTSGGDGDGGSADGPGPCLNMVTGATSEGKDRPWACLASDDFETSAAEEVEQWAINRASSSALASVSSSVSSSSSSSSSALSASEADDILVLRRLFIPAQVAMLRRVGLMYLRGPPCANITDTPRHDRARRIFAKVTAYRDDGKRALPSKGKRRGRAKGKGRGNGAAPQKKQPLFFPRLRRQRLVPSRPSPSVPRTWRVATTRKEWAPASVGIVVMDMWDSHWCTSSARRIAALAERMQPILALARRAGMQIIFAPSNVFSAHEDTASRQWVLRLSRAPLPKTKGDPLEVPTQPLSTLTNDGCDVTGGVRRIAWSRQIETLAIHDEDAVIASTRGVAEQELFNVVAAKKLRRLLYMGAALNMCMLDRPFALQTVTRWEGWSKDNVAVVRELTDIMYTPEDPPYVSLEQGLELQLGYVEKFWASTVSVSDLQEMITSER